MTFLSEPNERDALLLMETHKGKRQILEHIKFKTLRHNQAKE